MKDIFDLCGLIIKLLRRVERNQREFNQSVTRHLVRVDSTLNQLMGNKNSRTESSELGHLLREHDEKMLAKWDDLFERFPNRSDKEGNNEVS